MWCPERSRRPLKIRARHYNFRGRPYPYPQQVSKVNSLWQLNNVGKGSRQIGSVTSGQGLALRAESNGLLSDTCQSSCGLVPSLLHLLCGWCVWGYWTSTRPIVGDFSCSAACSAARVSLSRVRYVDLLPSFGVKRLAQNWHGPGESDCLIKTKHCDVH